jgi:hypothetical protein
MRGNERVGANMGYRSQCAATFGCDGARWTSAGLPWCEVPFGQRSAGFGTFAHIRRLEMDH